LNKIREIKAKQKKDGKENLSYADSNDLNSLTLFEFGTDPIVEDDLLPANKERKCCWNCMKVILKENSIEHYFQEKIMKYKVVNYSLILSI
jgi:hypothetical protein